MIVQVTLVATSSLAPMSILSRLCSSAFALLPCAVIQVTSERRDGSLFNVLVDARGILPTTGSQSLLGEPR